MTIRFEGTADRRKALAQALADYRIGEYTVPRDGNVEVNDLMDLKEIDITGKSCSPHQIRRAEPE